uniref:protein PRRC2A n=1 Tax=Oncorhynchus gorbuscha TaxID=8017 RepID=UPI001EAEDE27|nr:protein PRRC2A [Oncorhynchus gorbuscha]
MASVMDDSYRKVLLLGAIAAASAFVVTIVIVVVCVGCQRKNKTKHPPANGEKGSSVDLGALHQPKNSSISKSDTRLHEINRLPRNGNSGGKNRPASMDLLLLHSHRSTSDLRPPLVRQLPQIPTSPEGEGDIQRGGEEGVRDPTYTEVGIRNSPIRCFDNGLYESVGVREVDTVPPAPPPTSANTPATPRTSKSPNGTRTDDVLNGNRNTNGNGNARGAVNGSSRGGKGPNGANGSALAPQDPVTAEYASIRKVKKVDEATKKENVNAESDGQSSVGESPSAPPPPLPRSQEFLQKQLCPFHLHVFPKEAVFMGNGEQYIWKPPEDNDIIALHPAPIPPGENGQGYTPTAMEISDTYSTVCKTQKKKPPPDNNGANALPQNQCSVEENGGRGGGGGGGNGAWVGSGGGVRSRGRGIQGGQARSHEEPCYAPVGDRTWPACVVAKSAPAYATIDSRKREPAGTNIGVMGSNATLKPKKKPPQQEAPSPGAPGPQGPPAGPPAPLTKALPGGENFYETISDVKQGANTASTTTIFTFNDGMEMYVTGL